MRALLEAGANPSQKLDNTKRLTAAHVACLKANLEMLELMLHFGVSANDRSDGLTLLVAAIYNNREGVVSKFRHVY
jgi:ankyrin repeat protein